MIQHYLSRKIFVVNHRWLSITKSCAHDLPHSMNSIRALYIASKEFMPENHDRQNREISDELSSGSLHVTNIASWKRYIFLGTLLFMIFYWMIPAWLNHELNTLQTSTIRPIAEALFMRRIHWIQWAGIALGSICVFFAIRNYLAIQSISRSGGSNISFFSRLLAKLID